MDFSLEEELASLASAHYEFDSQVDVASLEAPELNTVLDRIVDAVSSDPEAITDQQVFNTFRSLLLAVDTLSGPVLFKLLDSISSGFVSEIEATTRDYDATDHAAYRAHKQALEMYAFLLQWFVSAVEKSATSKATEEGATLGKKAKPTKPAPKKKRKDDWSWVEAIPGALEVMAKALRLRTQTIWQTTQERDNFVSNCFLRPANLIAESEVHMKINDVKMGVFRVVCIAAKNHGQAFNAQMSIMQNLQYTEHLSEPMAELVALLAKEFDYSQLGEEVLREISGKHFDIKDTRSPRSFSKFLIRLAEMSPRLVLKQIALLQKHLDSESYPMRNAIIEVIGLLIKELSKTDDGDPEQQKRQLESFFELLFERFLDLNGYVRSKVTTVLLKTCDLPIRLPKLRMRLADLTIRSLQDKSSQVRKNCIALLTKLILTHPYGRMHGGELSTTAWEARYNALCAQLEPLDLPSAEEAEARANAIEMMRDDDEDMAATPVEAALDVEEVVEKEEAGEEEGEGEDDESGDDDDPKLKKSKVAKGKGKPRKSDGIDLAAADQSQLLASVDSETLTRLRLTKKYYADAIAFIAQLDRAMLLLADLLASKVKSEVLEAMEFFTVAFEYKIEAAEVGVRRMLHLIWAKDEVSTEEDGKEVKGIRSRLIECYSQLYFEPVPNLEPKEQISRVAQNVIELTREATLAELTSLEQLLGAMIAKGVVHEDVITKLWQVYGTNKEIPRFQRRGAIIVLGMFAVPKPDVVADSVETLLKVGLGPRGKADLVLAKYTCIALNRVSGSVKKVKGSLDDVSIRLPMDSPVFTRLQDAIQNPSSNKEWFSMAEQAINTIYGLGDQPDALCSTILREMTTRVFGPPAVDAPAVEDAPKVAEEEADVEMADEIEQTQTERSTSTASSADRTVADAFQLSQLIFVAGHCAIKQLVHLELVERDIKRRRVEADKNKAGSKSAGQDELDQVAGSVEDEVGDVIAHTKETELLYGPESLLAVYGPMAVQIVSQPKVYRNSMLKTAATLAMSKFMCVSAKFCEDHLMLLFKILETSREDAVRSNIVIALGDIAVCFSTIMDENSDRLYAGLHDRDLTVKKNTLMVLTHLILNGMIKVKGQLGEMAKCLEDEDRRISDLAKLFFTELSTKDKAIYNNLPDIISHLSSGVGAVDEEVFCKSIKFIFTFVDKKKEAESIVEKLCQRFQMAPEARQWRDIAFCLSLLPFNSEIAVKKLVEGLPFYQDKLHEETVFKRFQEILTKARSNKASKNDSDLKEFEDALEAHRMKGQENEDIIKKVQKSKKRVTKAKAKPKRRTATPAESGSE